MPINFANGTNTTLISKPPRVVSVTDPVGGCPPSRSNPLWSVNVTIDRPAWFFVQLGVIRNASGRSDLSIRASGPNGWSNSQLRVRLNYTSTGTWDDTTARWTGYVAATGTYTFMAWGNNSSNVWGCGASWGRMDVLTLEV